jgi:hypothetical protein
MNITIQYLLSLLSNRGSVNIIVSNNSGDILYSGSTGNISPSILNLKVTEISIIDESTLGIYVKESLTKFEFLLQCPNRSINHTFEVEAYSEDAAREICVNEMFSAEEKDAYDHDEDARLYLMHS